GVASANVDGSAVATVSEPLLGPLSPGGGFSSQRRPYVRESRAVIVHVSWPKIERFVACENWFERGNEPTIISGAVPASAPAALENTYACAYVTGFVDRHQTTDIDAYFDLMM